MDADLGLGQWPSAAVQTMEQQRRQILTYNFIKVIVDAMAGSIMQVPFDPEFIPVNGKMTSLTQAIQKAMYSDKEIMNWDVAFLEVVTHGLIHQAAAKIVIDDKYNDLGNIGLEICLAGSVLTDPYWKAWSSRKCRRCWKESYLTPDELVKMAPHLERFLGSEISQQKLHGDRYDFDNGAVPFPARETSWGNAFQVISEYEVTEESFKREYVITAQGKIPIPDIEDDRKIGWLNQNVPDWQPENVFEKMETHDVSRVRSIVPEISFGDLAEEEKTEIQVDALPFLFWSASRHNGQNHSIVDSVKDVQKNINYWESMLSHKIQTEGGGGSQFVDPAGFKDRDEYLNYVNNRNIPTKTFEVKEGLLIDGKGVPAKATQQSGFPRELYENLNHMINVILPSISKVTPATLGRTESGTDVSGKLFESLKIQSDIQAFTINFGLRQFYNDYYEAYLIQAGQTYANERVPRDFPINKGRDKITLNERIVLPDGSVGIKNDAAMLKEIRHKVIISQQQASATEKRENADKLSKLLSTIPETKLLTRSIVFHRMIQNLDQLNDDDRELLEHADKLELDVAEMTLMLQKARLGLEIAAVSQAGPPVAPGETPGEASGESVALPPPEQETQAAPQATP